MLCLNFENIPVCVLCVELAEQGCVKRPARESQHNRLGDK